MRIVIIITESRSQAIRLARFSINVSASKSSLGYFKIRSGTLSSTRGSTSGEVPLELNGK
jgi:hypothetical protein